ncbi:MAG: glycoside hydrolase family 2 [Clostridia bacterium]|nr:glycoside hydrolase family 2 [Clostridia bacterium]
MRLKTKYNVGEIPLSEYPRPQFRRDSYLCLNGVWQFQKQKEGGQVCGEYQNILVPFSPETLNSGVAEGFCLGTDERLVYRRSFTVSPSNKDKRALLHFGAVDQSCEVFVGGTLVGKHDGGYVPFCLDISEALQVGENELVVVCYDKTEGSHFTRGKQSSTPGTIWYTPQSGIWQTVWLEFVPQNYIRDFTVKTDAESKTVRIAVDYDGEVSLRIFDGEREIYSGKFQGETAVQADFVLWSPENPKLYDFVLETDSGDKVCSYFGVRTFSEGVDGKGKKRLFLNGAPYFMNGVLDQGYWSDGLLTPPSNEAMYDELKLLKDMGFNMVRKHIKIEPMLWYYYCDKLGLIVWQDFVNGGGEYKWSHIALFPFLGAKHRDDDYKYFSRENEGGRYEFITSAKATVQALKNATCVGLWVVFNEGWGQFDSEKMTAQVKAWDDTRCIDSCSGWHDQGKKATTMLSMHTYYTPLRVPKDPRTVVLSEFGGYSKKTEGHVYSEQEFGYKVFKTNAKLQKALEKLYLKKLKPLIAKGLSACVYTQVSDVEEEINGLITYDREVVKVPVEWMRAINEQIKAEAERV